jgi:hypothetical protein
VLDKEAAKAIVPYFFTHFEAYVSVATLSTSNALMKRRAVIK